MPSQHFTLIPKSIISMSATVEDSGLTLHLSMGKKFYSWDQIVLFALPKGQRMGKIPTMKDADKVLPPGFSRVLESLSETDQVLLLIRQGRVGSKRKPKEHILHLPQKGENRERFLEAVQEKISDRFENNERTADEIQAQFGLQKHPLYIALSWIVIILLSVIILFGWWYILAMYLG